ncbi:MAG: histidine kinase N-terminal 7TM domain-containing protein, partial [Methanoregula sp.]|nr:histidine kinase N-terminal 7TM domain-containing protein [Methanoregula sp.]
MIIQYPPAVIFMLVAGTVSALLTWIGWRNRAQPISQPFILLMAAETIWIFGYSLELMSTQLSTVLLLNTIMYPAISTVPVAWLFIVLCYTGREHYLTWRTVPLFFIIPALVWILVLTNPYHYLYYTGFHTEAVSGSVIWIYEHGPLFWIHIVYCYTLALVTLVLAAGRLFVSTELYRRQTMLLVCAGCIPAACNMAYVFGLSPFPDYDLTPLAFLFAGIILALGIIRYQLFSAVPVAYSLVFSTIQDGVIVTNGQYRVIDLNPAAEQITGRSSHNAIGLTVAEVFPGLASVQTDPVPENRVRRIEVTALQKGRPMVYDVLVTPMDNSGTGAPGYLCLFRDISDRKQAELAIAQANKKISLLSSITSHDLSNKILSLSIYLELSLELCTDPLQKGYLDRQAMAVEAMREQIVFTREYQQLGTDIPVWQNVDAVINRAKKHVDLRTVTLTSSTGSLEVYADPMLEKVFYNLFDNAIKYGGAGISSITISTR